MYTIKDNNSTKIDIKNSKFICYLYKINNEEDINILMSNIKSEYKDANHYCYAYIIDNKKKSSDDGEPSGTAGIPILKVLDNNNLNNILAIVIRYFGGIKLGANGLIRAYTKSVTTTLKDNTIIELIDGYNLDVIFNYDKQKEIDYLLKDIKINNKIFKDNIIYNIDISTSFFNDYIKDKYNYTNIINKKIEK